VPQNEKIAGAIMERIQDHVNYARLFMRNAAEIDRMYRANPADKMGRGQAEPGKPKANTASLEYFRNIESVTSAVDAVEFGDEPWFLPWSDELRDDVIEATRLTQATMDNQHEAMGLRMKVRSAIRHCLNHGTLVAHTVWRKRERWIDTGDRFRSQVLFDGPDWVNIPIWRWHFDPTAHEIEDMIWCSFEYDISKQGLQEIITAAEGLPLAETRNLRNLDLEGKISSEGFEVSRTIEITRGYSSVKPDTVHVDEYWGIHPTKKNPNDPKGEEALPMIWRILIVNGKEWVLQMPNPYAHGEFPFIKINFIKDEESFYGLGHGDLISRAYKMINKRRNLIIDIVNTSLLGMWQRSGGQVGKMANRIRLYPGKIFDSHIEGVISPLPVNTTGLRSGFQMDQIEIEEIRAATAATSNVQAIQQGGTATEIRNIATESARRISTFATELADKGLRPFLNRQDELNQQFLPEIFSVQTTDSQGIPTAKVVEKADLLRRARFKMKVATDLEFRRTILRNLNASLGNVAQIIQAAPVVAPALIPSLIQMTKKTLQMYGINPNEAIPSEVVQQVMAAQKAQAQQQPGPARPRQAAPA